MNSQFKKVLAILLACATVLMIALLGGSSVNAVTLTPPGNLQVYLKLDAISGESTVKGYEQWIPVSDVQFGVETTGMSAGASVARSKPSFEEVQFTKLTDSASIPLFLATAKGTAIKSATFAYVKPGTGTPLRFLTVNLSNVAVTSYSFNDTSESISLFYSTISIGYASQKKDGTMNTETKTAWDVLKGTITTPVLP